MRSFQVTLAALALVAGTSLAVSPSVVAAVQARTFEVTQDMHSQTEASFTSKASIVSFTGRTAKVSGTAVIPTEDVAKSSGLFSVDLASLDTGIGMRNDHMRGFLETDKHPNATFKFTSIKVAGNKLKADTEVSGQATGDMTIHGVTRKVTVPVVLTYLPQQDANYRPGDWVHVSSEFHIKLSEYKIELPKPVLGVKVSDELRINVESMAKAQ